MLWTMPARTDMPIFWSMTILAVFGLLMIASASMGSTVGAPVRLALIIAKQVIFLTAGYIAQCWLANHFRLESLKKDRFVLIMLVMLLLLGTCLLFGSTKGARAWIRVQISGVEFSLQPSEFTKIIAYLCIAAYCGDVSKVPQKHIRLWSRPFIIILIYVLVILVFQNDLGSAAVITLIAAVCFLIPRNRAMRGLQIAIWILFFAGMAGIVFILSPYGEEFVTKLPLADYQKNRILSAINPFTDLYDTGYQLVNGLVSFATGGWRGLGYGNSVRKYTNFPAANTDFILAIVVEELGMIGFGLIFIPYMIIIIQLFRYALKMESERGRIILIGTAMYLVVHSLFNIGGVTGMIPLTGVPLLMISSGGSSTMSFMASIGIAQAVICAYRKGELR